MIKKIQCWKTTDGKLFENMNDSIRHEKEYRFKTFLVEEIFLKINSMSYKPSIIDDLASRQGRFFDALVAIEKNVEQEIKNDAEKNND